ncbi:hypothetical protein [Neolewinella sp.]|uniref:hypothetical protein n=1 Tax=Neolewinella sp. TaxID=2993543 RepID=UPI003B5165C6
MSAYLFVAVALAFAAALTGQPQPQLFALPVTCSKFIPLLSAGDGTEEIYGACQFHLHELPGGTYTLRFRGVAGTAVSRIVVPHH